MKKVFLKKVVIENFKSIKNFAYEFQEGTNLLSSRFGSGKTTIRESLDFVLGFKVDCTRPYCFENNQWVENPQAKKTIVEWLITVVEDVDMTYNLKVEDTGKTTSYFLDGMKFPNKSKYIENVLEIFGVDDVNTLDFLLHLDSFLKLNWADSRKILLQITNSQKVLEELQKQEKYKDLYARYFVKGYDEVRIAKTITSELKQLKANKTYMEGSIDSIEKNINVVTETMTSKQLEEEIEKENKKLEELSAASLEKQILEVKNQIYNENSRFNSEVESKYRLQKNLLENQVNTKQTSIKFYQEEVNRLNQNVLNIQKEIEETAKIEFVPNNEDSVCPTCGSVLKALSEEKQKEIFDKQIKEKNELLNSNLEENKNKLKEYTDNLTANQEALVAVKKQLIELEKNYQTELSKHNKSISSFEEDIEVFSSSDNSQEIEKIKKNISSLYERLTKINLVKEQLEQLKVEQDKYKELLKEEQKLLQLEELRKDYSTSIKPILEEHVNSFFDESIYFQLFERLKTSNELTETLELISNGKSYSHACSTGERILARISVCLGLQNIFNVNLPIFVDDFNDLGVNIGVDQQLILLETNPKNLLEMERF